MPSKNNQAVDSRDVLMDGSESDAKPAPGPNPPCAAAPDSASMVPSLTDLGEQQLFQSARACVQQHMVANAVGHPPAQEYPVAQATHAEVVADADLFHRTLNDLNRALGVKISKLMRLGGQELNLHLLYKRVTAEGGAMAVIKGKHWRDVGDAFHLPKTITSVSFVLKRGYMQYLWDYEQVYFHRKGGQPRVPAPASRYTKDATPVADAAPVSTASPELADVDAAAALAVAALRRHGASASPAAGTVPVPALLAATAQAAAPQHDAPPAATVAATTASPGAAVPLSLVATPMPGAALSAVGTGEAGTLRVVANLGNAGLAVAGALGNVPFTGILACPAAAAAAAALQTSEDTTADDGILSEPILCKRPRPAGAAGDDSECFRAAAAATVADDSLTTRRPELPETIHSLLSKLSLSGSRAPWHTASTQLTPGGRATAAWMELDAHKRCMVREAVRADEERFRAEQIVRDAAIAAAAARRRRAEALHAAEVTLRQPSSMPSLAQQDGSAAGDGATAAAAMESDGQGGPCACPPSGAMQPNTHLPLPPQMHAVHGQRRVCPGGAACPSLPSLDLAAAAVSEAPPTGMGDTSLMTHIHPLSGPPPANAPPCPLCDPLPPTSGSIPMDVPRAAWPEVQRGPVASPNVNLRPFDPSRHNMYAVDPAVAPLDLPWAPVPPPGGCSLPSCGAPVSAGTQLADSALLDEILDGPDESLWALQEDLMLEEPP